jgi:hypothetical protein
MFDYDTKDTTQIASCFDALSITYLEIYLKSGLIPIFELL